MPLIATYPYLVGSLAFFTLFASFYVLNPAYRRMALVSGLLSTPYSLLAVVFVPAYWEPAQVFRLMAGPEDLLFSFATGGLAWILVAGAYYATPDRLWSRTSCIRLLQITSLYIVVWLPIWLVGLPIMWAALIVGVGLWCFLVARDRAVVGVSIKGAAVFTFMYTLVAAAITSANPEFATSWTADALIGMTILGVPIEESLWAFEFAAIWPLLVARSLEMRPVRCVACGVSRPGG